MALADFVSDVMNWWPDELVRALGPRFARTRPDPPVVVRVTRAGTEIVIDGGEPVLAAEPVEILPILEAALKGRRPRPAVGVLVAPERYLKRRLAGLRLPRSRLATMALLDLQSSTPFDPDDNFVLIAAFDERIGDSSYHAVRKSVLAPVVAALKAGRFPIVSIAMEDAAGPVEVDRHGVRDVVGASASSRIGERAVGIGLAAAAAGLVAFFAVGHWRYAVAADRVAVEVEAAESQVRELRAVLSARDAKIAQIGAVIDEKKKTVPVVSIIEEMSRAIPDNTWLTEVNVTGDMVRFSGFSASAAALIPILEASPLFSAPTFMEPVVRAVDQPGERFSIAMKVEQGDG